MKRLVANILVIMLLFSITINLMGCTIKASYYTEEEHIQRITERILKKTNWWIPEGLTEEDFDIYALYNQNEQLTYCIIEYEPNGFAFVFVGDQPFFLVSCKSMYSLGEIYSSKNPWTPYIRDNNGEKKPILDENGERIYYDKSPYFVTNSLNERKYLLETDDSAKYICAIKKDGKFINLISGLEFEPSEIYYYEEHATISTAFYSGRELDI